MSMYLGNREGPEYRRRVCGRGRLLIVGQEVARQGPLGAWELMAAASALEEQDQRGGKGGGVPGLGAWKGVFWGVVAEGGLEHSNVLKDSLDLIRELVTASFCAVSEPRLTMADVVALYPSIRLERGRAALLWFMDDHTCFNQTLKDLCLRLANFVLTNNWCQKAMKSDVRKPCTGRASSFDSKICLAVCYWK